MRKLLAAALILLACDGSGGNLPSRDALLAAAPSGIDLLVLRVPQSGGRGRVYQYPAMDSVLWSSRSSVPAISRFLSFDRDAGTLLYVDGRGAARSLDFRLGAISPATQLRLASMATADGWNVYGVAAPGVIARSTPSAIWGGAAPKEWSFQPRITPRDVVPRSNGALLVVSADSTSTVVWSLHPPDTHVLDSLILPPSKGAWRTMSGDRIYFAVDNEVVGLVTQTLETTRPVRVRGGIASIVPTPSGNQLYVLEDSSRRVTVIDRYEDRVVDRITFPSVVSELRMDPLGRFLLARTAHADSAYLLVLSSGTVTGAAATEWRADLPQITWDASIALVQGRDVRFIDALSLQEVRVVRNGANDHWTFFEWNGFRPRAEGLDEPVHFAGPVYVDTAAVPPVQTTPGWRAPAAANAADLRRDSLRADSARAAAQASGVFTVSFAALLDETRANELAATIRVGNQRARVVPTRFDGTAVYRVVLGPYSSREEADQVGRASGATYWVFEGPPQP